MALPSPLLGVSDLSPSLRSEIAKLSNIIAGLHQRLEDALCQHEKALADLAVNWPRFTEDAKSKTSASTASSRIVKSSGLVAHFCSSGEEVMGECAEHEEVKHVKDIEQVHLIDECPGTWNRINGPRMHQPPSLRDSGEATFSKECKIPSFHGAKSSAKTHRVPRVHFAETIPEDALNSVAADSPGLPVKTKWSDLPSDGFELNSYWARLMDTESNGCQLVMKAVDIPSSEVICKSDDAFNRNEMTAMPQLPFGILHPSGSRKVVWSCLALLLIAYDVFALPLKVFPIRTNYFFDVVEWIITVFWTLDIFVNFRTAYFKSGNLLDEPAIIARNYFRTWFVLDLTLVILEWMFRLAAFLDENGHSGLLPRFRSFEGLRSLRLFRLVKLPGIFHCVEDIFDYALEKALISVQFVKTAQIWILLIKMIAALIVLIHLVTCGWYVIGDNTENGWTSYVAVSECGVVRKMNLEMAGLVHSLGAEATVEQRGISGTAFLYFNAARWVTAQVNGRTDQDARRNLTEMVYTCIVGVAGPLVLMAVFVGKFTNCMLEMGSINSEQIANQISMKEYIKTLKEKDKTLTPELLASLKEYIKSHKDLQKETEAEKTLLAILTNKLQENLLYEVRGPTLCCHKFFKDIRQESRKTIRCLCAYDLHPFVVLKGDHVFDRGEVCSRMFFASGGIYGYDMSSCSKSLPLGNPPRKVLSTETLDEIDASVRHVGKGMWISEAALWLEWRNRGYLTGREAGALFTLEAKEFSERVVKFVEACRISVAYAEAFAKAINENPDCASDLLYSEPYFPNRESAASDFSTSDLLGRRRSTSWMTYPSILHGMLPHKSRLSVFRSSHREM